MLRDLGCGTVSEYLDALLNEIAEHPLSQLSRMRRTSRPLIRCESSFNARPGPRFLAFKDFHMRYISSRRHESLQTLFLVARELLGQAHVKCAGGVKIARHLVLPYECIDLLEDQLLILYNLLRLLLAVNASIRRKAAKGVRATVPCVSA